MLQKLNERIQGVVAWLVVILIGITFTLFGVDYYMQSHQTNTAKVVVNDQPITEQAFEINYRRARGMQDIAHMTVEDEKKLQNQVLDQMITNNVMVQAARKNGFEISPDQANAAILNIPQFQEDGHFSTEKYRQALNAALFTQTSFQSEVRQGMLLNQQRFAFIGNSFALPTEIERFVRLYMQTRDYEYLTVPAAKFTKDAKILPDAITAYYQQHQKEFMSPEQVSLNYVTLSMNEIKKDIKISNTDVKKYYEENQNNYLTPAQWEVAHILFAVPADADQESVEQIKKKADDTYELLQKDPAQFEKLVATVSDDKLAVAEQGKLPWITAGQNDYDKVLSKLTKPGEISEPAKTKHGYEIFKLIAAKPVTIQPFSDVEKTIKEQLLSETAQTKYAQVLEQLSDLSYQSPDSLDSVSTALKLKIEKTELFSRAGGAQGFTKNPQVINAAFSHDVLELGNNSDPIQLDNDSVAVIRVNKHQLEKEQSLEIVKEQINKILTKQQAEAKAKELGSQLLNPVEDEKQKELMKAHQLAWTSVSQSGRDNDKASSLINDMAFNILRPESRDGVVLPNGDYVVVRLKQINDGNLSALDKEQQDSLVQQIEASYGMMDYDLYAKSLINQAQIVKH